MNAEQIRLEPSWKAQLLPAFASPEMARLKSFLKEQYQARKQIFPKCDEYFTALELTHFEDVKVVILGQDPYHGPGQAHGLSFSVRPGVPPPPSLVNIFKELKNDLGIDPPGHGYLAPWAKQGVLLLNAVLTVEAGRAASHQKQGWEIFTDSIIKVLNEKRDGIVFVLWGAYAQKKAEMIDQTRHYVLMSPHPSPLSAHRGFFGSRPFSKINAYLRSKGKKEIDWYLPPLTH